MITYNVEIDDGDGDISWIEVEAVDDNDAIEAAKEKLASIKPDAESDLMVVITLEKR